MEFRPEPGLETILADRSLVKQILYNLFDNDVKFTPDGGLVTIRACGRDSLAKISVKDNGIGISEENLEKIFQPFVQVDSSSRKYGGAGLRLSIFKKFVELHDGNIRIESTFGEGSTFVISLPVKQKALIR